MIFKLSKYPFTALCRAFVVKPLTLHKSDVINPAKKSSASVLEALKQTDPRFEQTELDYQPAPQSAMELIAKQPVVLSSSRIASCSGGHAELGHPKVFINLDKGDDVPCGYCGLRFRYDTTSH